MLLVLTVLDYAGLFVGYGGRMFCKGTQQDSSGYETTIGIVSLLAFKAVGPRDRCKSNLTNSFLYSRASSVCKTLEVVAVSIRQWLVLNLWVSNDPFTGLTKDHLKAQIFTLQFITIAKL